jgi:hypothetical protein
LDIELAFESVFIRPAMAGSVVKMIFTFRFQTERGVK